MEIVETAAGKSGESGRSSVGFSGTSSFPKSVVRKQILQLVAIMICVALAVAVTSIWLLYRAAFDEQRARLIESAQSQARIIEAIARLEMEHYRTSHLTGDKPATLRMITDILEQYKGFGETGEFTLGRREGDNIVFLIKHRHFDFGAPKPVPWIDEQAEPMRRALKGLSGTVIGLDYRGVTVLAAYEPVAVMNSGIVAKIDLSEIRGPFIKAGLGGVGGAFIILIFGILLFRRVSAPILQREIMELALRESEERYALAAVGTNDGIWDWNFKTGETYRSPRWYGILGYDEEEFGTRSDAFQDYLHPDDQALVKEAREAHLKERVPYDLEYRLRQKSGDYVWIRVKGQAVWDEKGEPIRMAGSISDISDLKRAESELRESERKLRAITDYSPSIIYLKDTEGRVQKINKAYEKFNNITEEQALGRRGHEWLSEEFASQMIRGDKEVISTGVPKISEFQAVDSAGGTHYMHSIKFPVLNEEGAVIAVGGISTDITEQREREAQLRQAQKMEAVGQLTGGIAHEFNNLLMIILGNLERASNEALNDAVRKSVASAMKGALRAAELTNQLLAFSRKQDLRAEHVDLNALVRGMREMLQRTLGETVSVAAELADGVWPVLADTSLLESALLNLSLNARDAMPTGGRITITTSNRIVDARLITKHPDVAPGDYVMLEVADTGCGIAPENLTRVFEPFFTTKDVGEGTGLGLSMILGFAEQSGGFVDIESRLGQGTEVRVYLPRMAGSTIAQKREKTIDTQIPSVVATILVVEDDPEVREIVVGILSGLGCNVIEAGDGKTALSRLDGNPNIDVLFTDVVLPGGLSGPEIVDEARRRLPDLKVVLTSGYPDGELTELASGGEQHWFIRKPYRKSELAELLDNVLNS